jgi:hypothetical protein
MEKLPDYIAAQLPNPFRQAREYLRLRGVAYNDLITGDHAAALFVEWTKAITDRDAQILKMIDDHNAFQINPIRYIPGEAAAMCDHAEGRAWFAFANISDPARDYEKCGICMLVRVKP